MTMHTGNGYTPNRNEALEPCIAKMRFDRPIQRVGAFFGSSIAIPGS